MSSTDHLSELESLRSQVADLSRQLAERDRSAHDMHEHSDLLRAIVEGTAAETGEEFFASLVTHLTSVLKVQYAVIGEVQGDRIKKIRTLAVSAGGALVDNFEYELTHTPCATALTQTFAFFDRGVQATFPQFQRLVDLGAESYCAVPLRAKSGAVMGLLVVMDTKPLEQGDYLQSLLGVFAPRIVAEFERKRAEQERTQAMADLHNVMESIPDVVFVLNTQGNMVKWNRRVRDVTGYSHEELLNMPALAFVPPEEQTSTAAAIQRAFTDGYAELEGHLLTKDHRVIPYHWTGALLKSSHGEPIGITGIGRDVSDKKRAEEALHKSEQRFALAVEGSNDILWDAHRLPGEPWYAPQTQIWWSPRVRELLGLQESDSFETFEHWFARLHPDDKDRVFGQLAVHIEHRVPYDVEYRLRTNAGDYCWIRGRGQALWNEQGEPRRMSGSCQNISTRKATEQLLAAEKRILEMIATDAPLQEVLAQMCRAIEESSEESSNRARCSMLLLDRDGLHLRHGAAPSLPEAYVQAIDGVAIGPTVGSCGTAAFMRRQVIVSDIARDPLWADYRDLALCHGLRACWSTPVIASDGTVLGTFAVYYGAPQQPTQFDLLLIERATHLACITIERKRADALRDELLARLQKISSQVPGVLYQFKLRPDGSSCFPYASERIREIYRVSPDEVREDASKVFTILHPEDYDGVVASITKSAETMQEWQYEFRVKFLDGTVHWLYGSSIPQKEADGSILWHGLITDITERKRAEEALLASKERFDLAVRGSNTGIWDWDLRTGKTYFSPLWKSMLGYEEHELRGEFFEWEERLHPDDRERSSGTVRAYLDGVTPQYELEHRLRHKDGSYRWILARGVSIRDTEGKPYRMAGSHIDITEQRQIRDALVQSERQLRTVLHALPVGVWFTDRAGKTLLANQAAKQIWSNIKQIGLQTENLQAGWWETIGPANEPHRWALSHVLTTGVPSLNETFDFECLDGTKKIIRNSTVPVKNEDGLILGAIMLNEDITALRQAQAALQLTQFSVDHAVEGFLWIGPDARIFHGNGSICRMLEYTWEELTTMTLHDLAPDLSSEAWPAHWDELRKKGSLTFESKYWSRTGRVLDMEVTVNYLQYEGKEYNCAIMRDIGERKRAEALLRQSEERYRSLVDNAPIGIFLNEAGRFVYANREMLRILKATSAEQLIGTPVLDRIAPEFHTLGKDRILELTTGQSVPILDEKFVRLDGSQVDVAVSAIPASLVGNPVIQVLALDITERKRVEEALRQRERALRMAIEERERISQELHDGILQSLFAVGLALESAKLTMPPRNLKVSRASLNQAIDQLNDVMREIRNFIAGLGSDLLQGKDLPTALKQMMASLMEHQATRVRLAVEDRAAKALSTEQSLHLIRVIQEAVSNCIKHGHAQEARVSLKMLKRGVRLSVRDNGRGFNHDATKKTGRGLANMAARARKMGGRFTILSKVNEGTNIVLDLPKEAADVSR